MGRWDESGRPASCRSARLAPVSETTRAARAELTRATWPFVGRDRELATLASVLDLATPTALDGVALSGSAGVGKSRLVSVAVAAAIEAGWECEHIVATQATASVPLGALAHLLPDGSTSSDQVSRFAAIRDGIVARLGAGRRLLVVVDDVPYLDGPSVTLLTQLVAARVILLLATLRTGEPLAEGALALVRSERMAEIELGRLDRVQVNGLLRAALDGPVQAEAIAACWTASEGNPLFLRELVLGALDRASLVRRRGVWRVEGGLGGSDRLVELIARRFDGVGPDARAVAELLALCAPIGVEMLVSEGELEPLMALEDLGLVTVVASGRRREVRLAHPLHGEVLRESIPSLRRRQAILAHLSRLDDLGSRRREDPMRVAVWQLDVGARADPLVLLHGAEVARLTSDFGLAERLAEAAVDQGAGVAAVTVLGQARYELGAFEEAEAVLAAVTADDLDEFSAMNVAIIRHRTLLWGLGDPARSAEVLIEAMATSRTPVVIAALSSGLANVAAFGGRPAEALEIAASSSKELDLLEVAFALAESAALALVGRTLEGVDLAEEMGKRHRELDDPLVVSPPGIFEVIGAFALTEAGRLRDSETMAERGWSESVEHSVPLLQIWFALIRARALMMQGRLEEAHTWFSEGASACEATHFDTGRRMALAGIASCRGQQGRTAEAAAAASLLRECGPDAGFLRDEMALGLAWAAAAAGDIGAAQRLLSAAAVAATTTDHLVVASELWFDAARLGLVGAADELAALAGRCDGDMVEWRASGAAALESGDPAALEAAADGFEQIGALLIAAELLVAAAGSWRRLDDARAASAAGHRADALVAKTQGAATPLLMGSAAAVPLSRREREIALMAARGLSSKEIAERAHVSVRTVGNHLGKVYVKLGVTSRRELRAALER